jgi:hypothetical protein
MHTFLRTYGLFIYFLLLSIGALMTGLIIFNDQSDQPIPIEMQADAEIHYYSLDITFL